MSKDLRFAMLLDCYGEFLTPHQYRLTELYYCADLSLSEIAEIVGITRQVAVQAFQFGDGLCNLLTPLNGPMMGCLAMVGISFPKYIKWAFKYLMMNIGAAIVITMILQAIGWTGL